ncbi:DUF6906 family protein [Paenibacillus gyeongsangnamensis]|uniref:DUF6906 family protein n=1 Tax=Paenibacillus gyeongsangnamensis TaxID=3388067 RepID=UPI003907F77E
MKQGTKPTHRQRAEINAAGFDPENWLVERNTSSELVLVHRHASKTKVIRRG